MNDDRSLERAARSWIEAGPTQAPEVAVQQALSLIETTPQERDLRISWRTRPMGRFALAVAAVATLVVVAIGGSLGLGRLPDAPDGGAGATPGPSYSPPPSSSTPTASNTPARPPGSVAVTIWSGHSVGSNGGSTVLVLNEDGTAARDLFPGITFVELIGRTADGGRVLVKLRDGSVPEYTIALADVETGHLQPVPTDCPTEVCWADRPQNVTMTALSEDGRVAAIVLIDQSSSTVVVGTVELRTGATTVLEATRQPEAASEVLLQPTLSPDGRSIAYILSGSGCFLPAGGALMVVDLAGDSPARTLLPADQCALSPRWSPSGTELVVTTGQRVADGDPEPSEYHDIYLVSLEGGARPITTDRMSTFGAWTRDGRISYAVMPLDSGNMPLSLDVWIEDPATGEATKVDGTLEALGEAGCIECPFQWRGSEVQDVTVARWPRE
jgi:hypothetical protein